MKNETLWTILRTVLLGIIALFLAMQYWSSDLVEERLIQIQKKVDSIQNKVDKIDCTPILPQVLSSQTAESPKQESNLPNLLENDPFYKNVLPGMLGAHFKPYPLRFSATIGKPDNLHPFTGWSFASVAYSYCVGSVGRQKTGFYEEYSPYYAERMEERVAPDGKSGAYWVFLRKDVFWKPLRQSLFPDNVKLAPHFLKPYPVTAHDFKFYFDAAMNPFNQEPAAVVTRQSYDSVIDFKVIDDYTFVVEWKYREFEEDGKVTFRHKYRAKLLTVGLGPLPQFVYAYYPDGTKIVPEDSDPNTYRTNSTFAQQFTDHWAKNYIVSSGPYEFYGMDDEGVRFLKNPLFYNRDYALYGELEIAFRNSQDSIWNDFKNDKMSTYDLPSFQLPEYERFLSSTTYEQQKKAGREIKRLDYLNRVFTYIGWNANRPYFTSSKVRQALTYAIDRNRIIHEILNDQAVAITGPFFKESEASNPNLKPFPYDPSKARELLSSEGWKDYGDGILKKEIDGNLVTFKFTLIYFVKSTIARALTDFISTQLKLVGILCEPRGVEIADISAKTDDKDFDAILLSWVLAATEDPRQIWSSEGKDLKGSSNFIGFSNPRIDQIINLLEYEDNREKRKKLYWEFEEIVYQLQPYTFLFSPISILLYREGVENVFIPKYRQDLIPGATVTEPITNIFFERQQ